VSAADQAGDPGPEAEDLIGQTIGGRYTVQGAISRGAMGRVYRAQGPEGREVAVKRLIDVRQAARFDIEARLLSGLRHPRVVGVLEHFEDATGHYLVMELVTGEDLGRTLASQGNPGLPLEEVLSFAVQACDALRYVHEQGVVHRDVKPQNLIVGEHGVVLVDFGIARAPGEGAAGTRALGTPLYMAPEVLVGEAVSSRSDVYGLAATIWALITGRPPAYHEPKSLRAVAPLVTPELERTLRAALEPRPERRVASVEGLARALGSPLGVSTGLSLARSLAGTGEQGSLLESIVRTAAGIFEAAAASIALRDPTTGETYYHAAWGAGAQEIVGVRLEAGVGIAGAVLSSAEPLAVPDCRQDERFAAHIAEGTGYVPHTMLVVPLLHASGVLGVLSVLDRRTGEPYGAEDLRRAELFADLTVSALPAAAAVSSPETASGDTGAGSHRP
jgi:hypothetical protein